MKMAEHPIKGLMETAMENLKEMVDVNTIVGDAVESPEGTVIIPISKVAFGFGAGGSEFGEKPNEASPDSTAKFGGGSGGGVSISPVAFMVVGQGQIKLMPVDQQQSPATELIEKVPTLLEKILSIVKSKDKDGKCCKKKSDKADEVETIETVQVAEELDQLDK